MTITLSAQEVNLIQSATTYPAVVGRILTGLRDGLGYSQEEVATAVGLTQSTWSKIERGESLLSVDQLLLATSFLHTTPSAVLREADHAVKKLSDDGIRVHPTRVEPVSKSRGGGAFALIGAAALAVLLGGAIAALIAAAAKEEKRPKKTDDGDAKRKRS